MSSPSKSPQQHYVVTTFFKALTPGSKWEKDDLLDVVYWGKQVVAVCLGLFLGFFGFTGILAIAGYVAASSVAAQHYVTRIQKVDQEEVGGFWELAKEGFGAAFAAFMVTWITVFSYYHS